MILTHLTAAALIIGLGWGWLTESRRRAALENRFERLTAGQFLAAVKALHKDDANG
jgi:hypothetical protein